MSGYSRLFGKVYARNIRQAILVLSFFIFSLNLGNAQELITTVAGTGETSISSGGGPALQFAIYSPYQIAMHPNGSLYIGSYSQIHALDTTIGFINTVVNSSANINPVDMEFDSLGNLYITERFRVLKLATNGTITTIAGTGIGTYGSTGNGGPATAATFAYLGGITIDSNNNIYVADCLNSAEIRKINSAGIITAVLSNVCASDIITDNSGNLYYSTHSTHQVKKLNLASGVVTVIAGNGSAGYCGDGGPATSACLNGPYSIAFDSFGNMYIADSINNRVRKVSTNGIITTVAGTGIGGYSGDNGLAISAQIRFPSRIVIDKDNSFYIADTSNNRIRKVYDSGLAPATPINLTVAAVSTTQIDLSWTDSSFNETAFWIERKTGLNGTFIWHGGLAMKDAIHYSDMGLTPNTTYTYRIRAYGGGLYSAYSNEASITTPLTNPTTTYMLSGKVTENGIPLPNVIMNIDRVSTSTDSPYGSYSFILSAGSSVSIVPAKDGCVFSPSKIDISNLNSNLTNKDFTANCNVTYRISGVTKKSDGSIIPSATVTFTNLPSVVSDSNGYYYKDVPWNWTGIISAVKTGYTFSQANISSISFDMPNINIIASLPTYKVSGMTKLYDGTPLSYATVIFSGGLSSVSSDANGYYEKTVDQGWSGTITASKPGYVFSSETIFTVNSDKPGNNVYGEIYPRTGLQASESVRTTNWNTTYSDQYQKPCSQGEGRCGDPVETSTGAQILEYTLLTVQGVMPISFNLAYNSLVLDEGPAGKGWGFNYGFGARIEEISGDIKVHWSSNRSNRFNPQGSGLYTSVEAACRYDKLVKNTDGTYTLTMQDKTVYKFDSTGKLAELRNPKNQSLTFAYDASGKLIKITEPISGVFLNYAYNAQGLLSIVSDPLNRQVKLGYDVNRNLTTITDPKGHITTFTYNALGQTLTGVNAEGDLLFSNTYDSQGRIIVQEDGLSTNQTIRLSYYEEQSPGKIVTTITDRSGNVRKFTFDKNYQMVEKQDELGNVSAKYTYDDKGNRISATDGNAHATQFGYDAGGQMISVTDAAGNISRMTYDSNGNLISATDALGRQSTFAYDSQNNLITATDPQGNIIRYTYNANGQVLTVTSPAGNITTYQYAKGLPAKIIEPENTSRTMEYDAAGRLIRFADVEGNAYLLTYDDSCAGSCRAQTITDPLGNIVRMSYDSRGNILTMTDPKGSITRFTYDANGHRVSVINALNQTSRFEYDGEGRMIRVIDAKGNSAQVSYDAKGRVIRMTDALGNSRNIGYDKTNNVKTQTDALGRVVLSAAYNVSDNPSGMSDALGNTVKFEYDALQRLTQTIDGLNRATQFQYDVLGRLVMSTDAGGGQSLQTFDKESNLTGFKDPNANQTGFAFDKNGRMISETSASGSVVRYTYNARNLLAQFTNGRGQNRQFEYDKAGRISRITDPDGMISYTYDADGNVLTVSDAVGTITREYDALNRVVRYSDVRGNVIQYGYDEVGNLAVLTYPDAKKVSYAYDALNRMISVTDWAGRLTRYEYDANSNLTRSVRPNGSIITYSYNTAGQLIQQKDVTATGVLIAQYDFTYDAAGNIVEEKVSPAPEPFVMQPVNMTYTSANQLATNNDKPVTFDADGNMTQESTSPYVGKYKYYQFDSRNRLIKAGSDISAYYTYDAENNRIIVNEDFERENRYVVNPEAPLSQVLIRSNQWASYQEDLNKTYYVYGLGLIGEEYKDGTYLNYHFDLRGSTFALSNQQGGIADRFQYGPYGELVKHTGTSMTPFLYNGRDGAIRDMFQNISGELYYMRARYYDPAVKRFINQDVLRGNIGNGQSLNRYAYVNGNPVSYVDPLGLQNYYTTTGAGTYITGSNSLVSYMEPLGSKIMTRPLGFLQPTYILQTKYITPDLNSILDYSNLEGAHEHIFFGDGRNIGFSEKGFFTDSVKGYSGSNLYYDDNTMKLAAILEAKSVMLGETPYSLLGHNCQDYVSNVRDIYNQIKNKKLYPSEAATYGRLAENTKWLNSELDRIVTYNQISQRDRMMDTTLRAYRPLRSSCALTGPGTFVGGCSR